MIGMEAAMGLLFSSSRNRRLGMAMVRRVPIVRWVGPTITTAGLAVAAYFILTGRIDFSKLDAFVSSGSSGNVAADVQPVSLKQLGGRTPQTIRIATFNIQKFGKSKAEDPNVMRVLAQVVSQFDVVAIQEVLGGDATPVERLVQLLNVSGANYNYILSEPIGRTSYRESYAYVWDHSKIMLVPNSAYVVRDDADRMHREPMVASFQVRPVNADGRYPFSFTIINAHTDPDEVNGTDGLNELNVLDDVFVRVREYEYQQLREDDCILVGDLNVNTAGLGELRLIPNVISVGGDVMTNTRKTKTYDHILIDQTLTTEYTRRFGVLDFVNDLGLTPEQALLVSDHMPVWAEFSAFESVAPAAIASGPQSPRIQ